MSRPEEWKQIPHHPQYNIGESGRIVSFRTVNPKFIKPFTDSTGYLTVKIVDSRGKYVTRALHVLLLEAFGNPRPRGAIAKFLNDDRTDVRLSNLAWIFPTAEWRQPCPTA